MCTMLSHPVGLTLCAPWTSPARLLHPWDCSGKKTPEGCHLSSPGDLPLPEIEPMAPVSPAFQADSLSAEPSGKPRGCNTRMYYGKERKEKKIKRVFSSF